MNVIHKLKDDLIYEQPVILLYHCLLLPTMLQLRMCEEVYFGSIFTMPYERGPWRPNVSCPECKFIGTQFDTLKYHIQWKISGQSLIVINVAIKLKLED